VSNNQVLDLIIDRFGDVPIEHAPERPGDVKHTKASIKDITENTGWEPQFDFETGLDRTLAWWGLNGN
jgi:nucleoside-diphosphate-sugar epimerase